MDAGDAKALAQRIFNMAYSCHLEGNIQAAVELYEKSISIYPSSEAYAFLGWALSFGGKYEEAIDFCKKAIEMDPNFGNPWNDIGAYMIELGRYEEAIPYLEQAAQSTRYDTYCYPYYNLGRVYQSLGMIPRARTCFERSLAYNAEFQPARDSLQSLRYMVN